MKVKRLETEEGDRRFSLRLHSKEKRKILLNNVRQVIKRDTAENNKKENNFTFGDYDNNKMSTPDLAALLQQLLIKNQSNISAESFEKIIPDCDGESIPIKVWFENFEKKAQAYELSNNQKYVHARNKITGVAKLYLEAHLISDYENLKKILSEEFTKDYDSAEIHKMLGARKKKDTETFHEFLLNMSKIAILDKVEDSSVIKYIIEGLNVNHEAKYLLYSSKTIKQLRENYDIVEKLSKSKQNNRNDAIKKNNSEYKKTTNNMLNKSDIRKAQHCFNCGSKDHKRNECTTNTKCFRWNEYGHIARDCRNAVKNISCITEKKRVKNIKVNGVNVDCLVDTGADVTILKMSTYKKLQDTALDNTLSVLRGLGNMKIHPIGEFTAETFVDGISLIQKFVVVPDAAIQHDALLGYDFIRNFHFCCDEEGFKFTTLRPVEEDKDIYEISIYNVIDTNSINIVVPPQHEQKVRNMVKNYNPKPVMKCPIDLKIIPDGQIRPFRHAPSRLPPEEAEAVRKQVDEWMQNGIVRKSTSFVASRVVVVKKKCGTIRVCVDFRQLNKMVLKDCFPVPVMDDIFSKLKGAKIFTIMDLENGFFHVPIEETSKKYTAFVTKEGIFEFNVTPFGFCNSPAAFIRFVSHIFQDLINENVLELYMDDMIIFASTAEECLEKVAKVLKKAEQYNLKIKWAKCTFLQTRINFLGHIIENGEIRPGEEKVRAVKNFKLPKNIKAVQSFLGLTGFFRRFIPGYANIARPLTNLLKKDVVFKIGPEENNAIEQLKTCLTNEPVLRIYCREAPTELCTDASKHGFGAVLLQQFEGRMHPVFFWSKKTSPQEENRHSYILEVKAAYLAAKKFRNYLLGIRFTLVTDCAAFKQTINKKDITREVSQWIMYLEDFNFEVAYRPGAKIKHADFLSRHVLVASTEISARIKVAQQNDEHIKAITEIIKDRPYDNYKIKGGLIYKCVNGNDVLVVPKSMEFEIIKETHNVGHFATQKTTYSIQQKYWIPHLEKKVGQIINNCIQCIIHNKKLGKKEGFLNCIDKGDKPLDTLHVDHLGPMDATSKMYKYIFAIVDSFTKFVWLYPTKSTGCDEVIKKIKEWTNIFGNPVRIISDQGAAYTANAFKAYIDENRIEHILTTTGVARGNGQIERVNRSIVAILSKLSSNDTSKWYKYVPQVQAAINSHVHSSTKVSPFQLMFGVKMNHNVDDRIIQTLEDEIIKNFDEERNKLRENAKQQIKEAQATYKRSYDKKRKPIPEYKEGDLVAIKRTQFVAGKKLASNYLGPYKIVKVKRNGRYDVQKAATCEGPNSTSTSCDNIRLWTFIENNEDILSSGSDDEDQDGRV